MALWSSPPEPAEMDQFVVKEVAQRRLLFAFPPHEHGHRDAALYVKDL